jgi:hypothetical protein
MSNATRDNFKFTSVESCASFLEGLRKLHDYELETGKSSPSQERLRQLLDCANENLGDCVRRYPDDRIPHFYYGIVLTMKNQDYYANKVHERIDSLFAQGRLMALRESLPKAWAGLDPESDPWPQDLEGPNGPHAEYLRLKQAATPFATLVKEKWPLLAKAAEQFESVQEKGPEQLKNTAVYNLAQVLGRRGEVDCLQAGLQALGEIDLPSDRSNPDRSHDEIALALQIEILARHLRARLLIGRKGSRAEFDQSWDALEQMDDAITNSGLSTAYKIDLHADYLVKSGYVLYDQAIQNCFTDSPADSLQGAATRFSDALDVKKSWNQAQLYLAIAKAIQSGIAESHEESYLFGLTPPPLVGSEELKAESEALFESLLGKAAAPTVQPEAEVSEAEAFLNAARTLVQAIQTKKASPQPAEDEEDQMIPPRETPPDEPEASEQTS